MGPAGTQRLEGMEPDQAEELMSSLGQMLARIEEMRREQAEENRLFLETLQSPPALRPTPVRQYPSALPTPEPQDPSELPTPEVQDPAALPTTPVPRDPSAEG